MQTNPFAALCSSARIAHTFPSSAVAFTTVSVSADDKPGSGFMMHEHGEMPRMHHSGSTDPAGASGPSTAAYEAVMMNMHEGQQVGSTGDPDQDFARHIIPHYQSAIDTARVELQYNPEIRKVTEKMIPDQQKEVAVMQKWLNTHAIGAK